MDNRFFMHTFISFLVGIIFFLVYYYLSRYIGGSLTLLLILFVAVIGSAFYFRAQLAPNLDMLTFLEQYAEGKLSFAGSRKKNDLPDPLTGDMGAESVQQDALAPTQKESLEPDTAHSGRTSFFYTKVHSFSQKLKALKATAADKVRKKDSTAPEVSGSVANVGPDLPIPGPIFAGLKTKDKYGTDMAAAYSSIEKKDYNQALHWMKKGIMRYAGKKVLQNDLAVLYFMNQKYEEALLEMEKISLNTDDSALVFYNLSLIYMRKKMYQKALHYLQKSVQIKNNAPSHYHIASLFARAGKFVKTRQHLEYCFEMGYNYQNTVQEDPAFARYQEWEKSQEPNEAKDS